MSKERLRNFCTLYESTGRTFIRMLAITECLCQDDGQMRLNEIDQGAQHGYSTDKLYENQINPVDGQCAGDRHVVIHLSE